MRAVVAIGGNSLIVNERRQSVADQMAAVAQTVQHIAEMIADGWQVVITHGNGPQVGFNLLRSERAADITPPVPLDYAGAETQGGLGYLIQQTLGEELRRRDLSRAVATVVTQVIVDEGDPAFQRPNKPIGPFYDEPQAQEHARTRGWAVIEDAGRGWRRVVPSPQPLEIVEAEVIASLLDAGVVVIGVGGGGIPVVRGVDGRLRGVEAVIDKDYASSLLARSLNANLFLISTAVEKVALNFGKPDQRDLALLTLTEAKFYLSDGHFPPGSMGPKIRAAIQYLEAGGREALITSPEHIARALRGETGTRIVVG